MSLLNSLQRKAVWIPAAVLLTGALLLVPAVAEAKDPANPGPRPIQVQRAQPGDADPTLRAMRDEMERSRQRLVLPNRERPYYIEYRLLDIEFRSITASFGALLTSDTLHNRLMAVDVRVGDYNLDSSNFFSEDGFRGFLGSTGTVGIDGDYDSLRQDLWLATDQAYKQAVDQIGKKSAAIRNLARPSNIPDFSRAQPVVRLNPREPLNWTNRNWEAEARETSSVFRDFSQLTGSRVTYYIAHFTQYTMNSEGTQIRTSRSIAAIEAGVQGNANDGMPLHSFYSVSSLDPGRLPETPAVREALKRTAEELVALQSAAPAPDYAGPALFEAPAAASLVAQLAAPSLSGARSPMAPAWFNQRMEGLGGGSEWIGRLGSKVLPAGVSLVDDPTAKEFKGQQLLGSFELDEEGVPAERVGIIEKGILRRLLMSRRPGPDFLDSNGHARASFLGEPRPMMSNLFLESSETLSTEDLRKNFLETCRAEGKEWCLVVKRMDNPALAGLAQEDASDLVSSIAAGAANGDRLPLLLYKVYVADGHEELLRGGRLTRLSLRSLRDRNLIGIGNDMAVHNFFQSPALGFAGTALNTFGVSQGGIPTSVIAPSLLLEEVDVIGVRGQQRRMPLVAPPPLK